MYTPTSKKFSNFIQQLLIGKIREFRAASPKDVWHSRYNDDAQCFQAAVMVLEREHKSQTGTALDDNDILASEVFLASDDHFLSQLAKKALEEAFDTDQYIMDKVAWEVSTSTH